MTCHQSIGPFCLGLLRSTDVRSWPGQNEIHCPLVVLRQNQLCFHLPIGYTNGKCFIAMFSVGGWAFWVDETIKIPPCKQGQYQVLRIGSGTGSYTNRTAKQLLTRKWDDMWWWLAQHEPKGRFQDGILWAYDWRKKRHPDQLIPYQSLFSFILIFILTSTTLNT